MKPHWILTALTGLAIVFNAEASVSIGVASIGIVGSALYAGFDRVRCAFYECCSPRSKWTKLNVTALNLAFSENLYGQHLVQTVVPRALKSHLGQDQPNKALVMSFHGWTGGGKNYVARFITDSLYKLGTRSQYVHFFVSTIHFPHKEQSDIYKLHLQDWIRGNVSKCERSLFIFDEIDKMPVGMIDGIKPFIDYHENIDGVDFRKSIFIFLSNTGGPEITRLMLEMWRKGKSREEITMADMEHLIERGAFSEKGGLHKSELIQHSLVDFYVPFLPLERRHIEFCIRDEVKRRGLKGSKEFIKVVADEMTYFPPENQLFSTTGCKRVSQKVSYHIANEMYDVLFD
ncbi:torsin-1A-like [Macrobrachium nipponense]|uniref:torsin-1A-like n=1 Tax=Macrobrachium nipponense TaxID=159736 RepID=UPI0030C81D1F